MLKTTEHKEQCTVVQYCEAKKILVYAVPNGTNIPSYKGRAKAKAEGLRSGVCDLCIPEPRNGLHGLYIEMKKPKGTKPASVTEDQKKWIAALNYRGYSAVVCYGANEAINTIDKYLGKDISAYEKWCSELSEVFDRE